LEVFHTYIIPGTFRWTFHAEVDGVSCDESGDILLRGCELTCTATVPSQAQVGATVVFQSFADPFNCTGETSYLWEWGDGSPPATSTTGMWTHVYSRPGFFRWKVTATRGEAQCSKTGPIAVGCLQLGQLTACAETIAQAGNSYTLSGGVNLNGLVFFTAPVTFQGNPATGVGEIRTEGEVQVYSKASPETLLSGDFVAYDLDGNAGTLTPMTPDGNFRWNTTLSGIPLVGKGTGIAVKPDENLVQITPTFFVGVSPIFTLAELKATLIYPYGDWKELTGMELVVGAITPHAHLLDIGYTYDKESGVSEFTGSIDFPFMPEAPELGGKFSLLGGCINGWEMGLGGWREMPVFKGKGEIASLTLGMDHICDADRFRIWGGGTLAVNGWSEDYLQLKDIGFEYTQGRTLKLSAGEVSVMTFPLTSLRGTISLDRPTFSLQGKADLFGLAGANLDMVGDSEREHFIGKASGTLGIPNFDCHWTNVPCRVLRSTLRSLVDLPAELRDVEAQMAIERNPAGDWAGFYRGDVNIRGFTGVFQVDYRDGEFTFLFGPDYENLFEVGRAGELASCGRGSERSVEVPTGSGRVLFAAASDIAVPSASLRTPAGDTITPANAAQFAGVTYILDEPEKLAIFRVEDPAAGTWVIAEDFLPVEQVQFLALVPTPVPQMHFTSVQRTGDTVTMSGTVAAPPATRVSFLFARSPEGLDAQWIGEDLNAATGTVNGTWDAEEVPSGTYYILLRADDGVHPPTYAAHPEPILIDRGTVLPPSALQGTRRESEVTLTWTPSASPATKSYQVRYTDRPDTPGYPESKLVTSDHEAVVEGLDPERPYRFCAVAYDAQGSSSVESSSVTLEPGPSVPGDCDGSETVSIGEVQKAINMFLGSIPPDCGVDCNGDGTVSIGEVQKVINGFLGNASSC
jgi:PKD repeat protein